MANTLTDDQIVTAIDSAPAVVQEALRSEDTAKVITAIGTKHRLHIDQIGSLARINRNLLVGLVAPAEMYGELVEIGVSADEARQIMAEINEMIFIPLRERMRNGSPEVVPPAPKLGAAPIAPSQPPAPERIAVQPLPTAPAPHIAPAPQTQVFTSTGGWPGAPAGNWQPAAAVHVYVPGPAPVHTPATPAPVVTQPVSVTTLQQSVQPEPQTPKATTSVATQPPALRPTPPPPANLPGVPASESAQPLEKGYVADPYREPPL